MPSETSPFTAFTNHAISAGNLALSPGQSVLAAVSPSINNGSSLLRFNSFKLNIEYSSLVPATGGTAQLGALVESLDDNGLWEPIHYQFSTFRRMSSAPTRTLVMQPNLDTFNAGIDDVVYPVNNEVARISRHQGRLPETQFRLSIWVVDSDPYGPNGFQGVVVNAAGELYNV